MVRWKWLVAGLLVVGVSAGCSKTEEPAAPAPQAPASQSQMPASHPPMEGMGGQMGAPAAGPRQVQVPEEVRSTWKAVVLQVSDRGAGTDQDVTVAIGETAAVGTLEIAVENFVPHFAMDGGSITSASNDTVNPAVRLRVTDAGNEVFSGWLFSLYPETHPFQHETYGIVLKDFVKSE